MSVEPGPDLGEDDDLLPLAGVRVLDLSQMVAGPAASLLLADYGADVIKVEPPQGDGGRSLRSPAAAGIEPAPLFAAYNRDKVGTTLDLRDPDGRERVWSLLADADVVLESSLPGAMERLGLGADAVRERYPRIVYGSVAGFGFGATARRRRGVDLIVQAASGMMSLTGYPDGPPTKVGFTIVDAACGHALCHAVLAALFRRERTGRGATVRINLFDVAVHLANGPVSEYLHTGVQLPRTGNSAPHTAPADVFPTADGDVVMAAYLDPHWRALLDVLDDAELGADTRFATPSLRVQNRVALNAALAAHFRERTTAHWLDVLGRAGVLCAAVNDLRSVVDDPVTDENQTLIRQDDVRSVRSPARFTDLEPRRSSPLRAVDPSAVAFPDKESHP
jgi:crotonobetainyl-CoA:carnitine CoA-transferase CaiB-like acyl-CoA transferase